MVYNTQEIVGWDRFLGDSDEVLVRFTVKLELHTWENFRWNFEVFAIEIVLEIVIMITHIWNRNNDYLY